MKAGREHRVPLSQAALKVIEQMAPATRTGLIFPAPRGFRSTFRDWCAECTDTPRDVAEMALAHAIGDKVEAAYRRGDLFDKHRALMMQWAAFCGDA